MESALARSARCRTGDCAVALVAFVATHSQGRHHCGTGWRNADGSHVGQGAGTNGQSSSSVAGGRRVVAYRDHRARCSGIRAVKWRAAPPDADLITAIGNEQTRRRRARFATLPAIRATRRDGNYREEDGDYTHRQPQRRRPLCHQQTQRRRRRPRRRLGLTTTTWAFTARSSTLK